MTPDYWSEAKRDLAKRDAVLRKLMRRYPDAGLRERGNAFQTLAHPDRVSRSSSVSAACRASTLNAYRSRLSAASALNA